MDAARMWFWSTQLQRRGQVRGARLLKALIYLLHGALLEPEAELSEPVIFAHRGKGVVVHATTVIEPDVMIYQNVLIAASNDKSEAGDFGVRIRGQAIIGAGTTIMCPRGRTLTIGRGARIAAGSIVTGDVPDGGVVMPRPSELHRVNPPELWPLSMQFESSPAPPPADAGGP